MKGESATRLYGCELFFRVTRMDYFAWFAKVIHKLTMRERIDLSLRSLVWNGQNEFVLVLEFRSLVVTTNHVEVSTAG